VQHEAVGVTIALVEGMINELELLLHALKLHAQTVHAKESIWAPVFTEPPALAVENGEKLAVSIVAPVECAEISILTLWFQRTNPTLAKSVGAHV